MHKKLFPYSLRLLAAFTIALFAFGNFSLRTTHADSVAQVLPFTQNWSNAGLITTNDDWSGVPGITGYRGDSLTGSTGTDPQTILGEGTPVVNVIANQSAPDTLSTGGVAEFDGIPNPVVALNGSATADAPNIVISVNTSGDSQIHVAYNLRDLDGSADNSVQAVALQYRIGATGNFTNVPAGFVADATSGPNLATLVTPVSATLPAACDNQSLVQLRVITSNAVGNDEWVGIDDINITAGSGGGTINLSANGLASPNNLIAGGSTLLTVNVTPANTPPSTGITVQTDLSAIGGSATQQFFDDGTNGDVSAGDNTFSFLESVPANTPGAAYSLPASIADAQTRTANTSISLSVSFAHDPSEHMVFGNPSGATADISNPDNFLIMTTQYAESYNRDNGEPNWVSWHLDSTWLGDADRQNDFRPNTTLPAGWYQVQATDYSGSGFDRGHMCPSADRSDTLADNSSTFLMTNFVPQAPANNQGPWEQLESYLRTLVQAGNELYIVAGPAGMGGTGSLGGLTNTVAAGHVVVPAYTWKVVIVLPNGADDVNRVNRATRLIAVIMPNAQSIGQGTPWRNFRVPVNRVEGLTGYHFFENIHQSVKWMLKRRLDFQ